MALHWTKEDSPRWDVAKQRLFGPEELAAVGYDQPAPEEPIANEWWTEHGFTPGHGDLRRQVRHARTTALLLLVVVEWQVDAQDVPSPGAAASTVAGGDCPVPPRYPFPALPGSLHTRHR